MMQPRRLTRRQPFDQEQPMSFHPYLNFGGNCREAFERYHEIFGGELEVMAFGDAPAGPDAPPMSAEMKAQVMHASLRGGDMVLLGSDDPQTYVPPQGIAVTCQLDDPAEADRVFAALAEGGDVQMPIGQTFWALRYGACIDRYGIPWMVNVDAPMPD
jgi:PhnB protein